MPDTRLDAKAGDVCNELGHRILACRYDEVNHGRGIVHTQQMPAPPSATHTGKESGGTLSQDVNWPKTSLIERSQGCDAFVGFGHTCLKGHYLAGEERFEVAMRPQTGDIRCACWTEADRCADDVVAPRSQVHALLTTVGVSKRILSEHMPSNLALTSTFCDLVAEHSRLWRLHQASGIPLCATTP